MEIGEIIRQLRIQQGLKQIELASKAGISNTYLSDIEVCRTIPSLKALLKISEALGVDCSTLLKTK